MFSMSNGVLQITLVCFKASKIDSGLEDRINFKRRFHPFANYLLYF